jgi:hypothetical protein
MAGEVSLDPSLEKGIVGPGFDFGVENNFDD